MCFLDEVRSGLVQASCLLSETHQDSNALYTPSAVTDTTFVVSSSFHFLWFLNSTLYQPLLRIHHYRAFLGYVGLVSRRQKSLLVNVFFFCHLITQTNLNIYCFVLCKYEDFSSVSCHWIIYFRVLDGWLNKTKTFKNLSLCSGRLSFDIYKLNYAYMNTK